MSFYSTLRPFLPLSQTCLSPHLWRQMRCPEAVLHELCNRRVNRAHCSQVGSNSKRIVLQLSLIKISGMSALFQMRQPDEKKQQVIITKQVNKALLELQRK